MAERFPRSSKGRGQRGRGQRGQQTGRTRGQSQTGGVERRPVDIPEPTPFIPPEPIIPPVEEMKRLDIAQSPSTETGTPQPEPEVKSKIPESATPQFSIPSHPTPTSDDAPKVKFLNGRPLIPPQRPSLSKEGNPIALAANFFEIVVPNTTLFQYDVKIYNYDKEGRPKLDRDPIKDKYVCRNVMRALFNKEPLKSNYPAYDGLAILYSKVQLPSTQFQVEWDDPDDGGVKCYHFVQLQVCKVDTSYLKIDLNVINQLTQLKKQFDSYDEHMNFMKKYQMAVNAADVILKQLAASIYTSAGRNYYFERRSLPQNFDLGLGRCVWEGFSQSLRPGQQKPYVNIDMSYRSFIKPISLLNFLCETGKIRDWNYPEDALKSNKDYERAQKQFATLHVYTDHNKYQGKSYQKKYKIKTKVKEVFLKNAIDEKFPKDGSMISVQNYFRQEYGIKLDFPNLPCINVGKGEKNTALPIELCRIKNGQNKREELEATQIRNMIAITSNPANERRNQILDIAHEELPPNDPLRDYYGFKVINKMVTFNGRKLNDPVVHYSGNQQISAYQGQWKIANLQLVAPAVIKIWVLVHFKVQSTGQRFGPINYIAFIQNLRRQASDKGINLESPLNANDVIQNDLANGLDEVEKLLIRIRNHYGPELQMIMCIINRDIKFRDSFNSDDVYSKIKEVGDVRLPMVGGREVHPIITQCIDEKNVKKNDGSTLGGICLKINVKMGGVNHYAITDGTITAELLKTPLMILGADVNHPKPGTDIAYPSIAAAVCSIDRRLVKYASACRFQKNQKQSADGTPSRQRQEIILDFQSMSLELLRAFLKSAGKLPHKIIYYRDGVSEKQFQFVLENEMMALRAACEEIEPGYAPPITLVCVQKRHHTRMFVTNPRDAVGAGKNIPPGTYVDHTITHPYEYDFYLCSHMGLKGTSKPTHYHVLWDDNNFRSEQLITITHQLCHCYSRCTKSVSIPPPVYYSDLIAYRYQKYFTPIARKNYRMDTSKIDWDKYREDLQVKLPPVNMYWA